MEILGPNVLPIVVGIALFLTVLSLILLIVITVIHWRADEHEKHISTFDHTFEPVLVSYLNGKTAKDEVIALSREDSVEALNLLIHLYQDLDRGKRDLLDPLFAELIKIDAEVGALESHHVKYRLLASERLGYLKTEASANALLNALNDEVPAIRLSAARSLAAHGKPETIEPILLALDLPAELDELREVEAVFDFGPSAEPELLELLKKRDGEYSNNVLIVAMRVLGMLKSKGAVEPITSFLKSPEKSIRINAAYALGEIGDSAPTLELTHLADDPEWEVRNKAIKALGELNAEQSIPVFSKSLCDTAWWVRSSAAQALHSLGEKGVTVLHEIMTSTNNEEAQEMCREVLEEHNILDKQKG